MLRVRGRLLLGAVVAPVLLALSPAVAPAAAGAPATTTFVTMVGDEGASVIGNRAGLWRPGPGTVSVAGSAASVSVDVSGGSLGESYNLRFLAPGGETLHRGTYDDVQSWADHADGHAGIDISGEGNNCDEASGRFTVLDVAPDLSRLWLTYEMHCDGRVPAVFGEVRYREPGDPRVLVAPDRIAWPAEYPHVAGRVVPVTVVNTSQEPITGMSASVTDGDADFSVASSDCSTVAPNDSCTVYVVFEPASIGPRTGTLTVHDSTGTDRRVLLVGDGTSGRTSWDLSSETGDWVGGGTNRSFQPADTTMRASGSSTHVTFLADNGGSTWTAEFEPGNGQMLASGKTFTNVGPVYGEPTPGPKMDVSGNGRGCNTVTGSFTVQDAAYKNDVLSRFVVDFEQHCEGDDPALTGTISWRADTGDRTAPSDVTDLGASPAAGSTNLTWTNPGDADWAETVVRRTVGSAPATSPEDGTDVYHGRHTTTTATGLARGTDYTFTAFPVDTDGNVGGPRSLTLQGTSLSAFGPASSSAGSVATLHGRLTDGGSGAGIRGVPVAVESRRTDTSTWSWIGTVPTDNQGRWSLVRHPVATSDYRATYAGGGRRLGATRATTVKVAPKVSMSADHTHGARHARFALGTHVYPNGQGLPVTLQRWGHGRWQDVATKRLDDDSTATFGAKPGHKGTFSFRIRRAADATHVVGVSRVVRLHVR